MRELTKISGRRREAQSKNVYFYRMYVRRKKNRSGTISVVVVSKAHGRYREVKSFGTSDSAEKISALVQEAEHWIRTYGDQLELDFEDSKGREFEETTRVINNMDAVLLNGTQLLLNRIYDSIGFDRITDDILRHLVICFTTEE